ncbi:NAD-dependent epimerase/dehydratase family protein [Luminiphilus sp.]|nr:NAD-dependent epimerase/dehydratase family protein [Luminiphilus sp.]
MDKKVKLALIGGSGFIGSELITLCEEHRVDYQNFDLQGGADAFQFLDIASSESTKTKIDADVLINLAAEHRDDVSPASRYYDTNVQGAVHTCELAASNNICHIIFASSVAVYGFSERGVSVDSPINPFNDYGRSKAQAEEVYLKWQAAEPNERKLTIVRPTVVFGPGNRGNVYNLINQISSKRFVMLGSGHNVKSMAFVRNVAAFMLFLSRSPQIEGVRTYNYADKPDLPMRELVQIIGCRLHGSSYRPVTLPVSMANMIGYVADATAWLLNRPLAVSSIRVKKFMATTLVDTVGLPLDFSPPVSLEEGLVTTLKRDFSSVGETAE